MASRRAVRLAHRLALLALRALVLVLALHVSGTAHAIVDAADSCSAEVDCPADCPCGPADCPPGCPNCHAHGVPALPKRREEAVGVVFLEAAQPTFTPSHGCQPPSPELAGPFRPPQTV